MDNGNIEYRPYKSSECLSECLIIITMILAVIFFVAIGIILRDIVFWEDIWGVFFFGILGVMSLFMSKGVYDESRLMVIFEPDGLRLINDGSTRHYYISYKSIPYGYYISNYMGNLYLILSLESKNQIELKRIVKRYGKWAIKKRIRINDNIILIPLLIGGEKEISQIKKLILKNISYVDNLCFFF